MSQITSSPSIANPARTPVSPSPSPLYCLPDEILGAISSFLSSSSAMTFMSSSKPLSDRVLTAAHESILVDRTNSSFTIDRNEENKKKSLITKKMLKLGNVKKALEMASLITENRRRSWAFVFIVEHLTTNGQTEKALETISFITDEGARNEAFTVIASHLIMNGQIEKALDTTEFITGAYAKGEIFNFILTHLAMNEQIEKTLELVKCISTTTNLDLILFSISEELINSKKIDEACKVSHAIKSRSMREFIERMIRRIQFSQLPL